jgi:MFS family permease
MASQLPPKVLSSIALLNLAGQLAWAVENQYFNLFIYNVISPTPFYVSLMVAVSAVASTLTAIFMGTLSDSRGKRKVFMLVGYVCWAFTTAMFPLSGYLQPVFLAVTVAIVFDCIMTFFGATANDAALSAYVTDMTTRENRGKVGSIMEIMFLVATLAIYGSAGFIIEAVGYFNFFYIVGAVVGIIGVAGAIRAPEPLDLKPVSVSYWALLKSTFNAEQIKANGHLFLVLLAAAAWGVAFNCFFPFVLIYLQHYLHVEITTASILIFIALAIAIVLAFPVGKAVDKIGRKKLAAFAVVLESVSLLCFSFSENLALVTLFATLWVFAMVTWDVSSRAWLKDLYPKEKRGQFSGLVILFSVLIGMTVGPLVGGAIAETYGTTIVLDGVPGFVPPPLVFLVAAGLVLLTLIPLVKAREPRASPVQHG